jgi:glycerophosphoryl diester phosphodiesterase
VTKFLDATPPVAIAHRGGHADGKENTLAAFRQAVELGYDYLETDVHMTADGVLVAMHDDDLDRVTDMAGNIADMDWAQVSKARIGGQEPVPKMVELLDAFPEARFMIDPKSDTAVDPLIRMLSDRGDVDRVCIGSFEQRRLRRVRRALPVVATAAGPWEIRLLRLASWGVIPKRLLHPSYELVSVPEVHKGATILDESFVRTCHDVGVPVHVWTVNERSDMHRMLNLGVDGIVTDESEDLREVFIQRGCWNPWTRPS